MSRPSFFVWLALAAVRAVSLVVPRRDRPEFRREWNAEILNDHFGRRHDPRTSWRSDMSLFRRSLGSFSDAAWLRRQFTRDNEFAHDVRHALRLYRRSPGMLALIVAVLAIGLATSTAVFSAVNALLLQPVPYADADRAMMIWQRSAETPHGDMAPADFLDLRDRLKQFDVVAAAEPFSRDYVDGGEPEIFTGARVTAGFFDVLRTEPTFGRLFNADDYLLKRSVVILSDAVWKRRFGGTPDTVGKTVRLDGESFEVVGILPPGFEPKLLRGKVDVWSAKTTIEDYERRIRSSGYWNVVARLRAGTSLALGQQELDAVSAKIAEENPKTNKGVAMWAMPLRTHLADGAEKPLSLLAVGALLMLLLAMGSAANLQMTVLSARLQEFVVRAALGAHRRRLVRQVLSESVVLAIVAVAAGVALSTLLMTAIRAVGPEALTLSDQLGLNARVLIFASLLGLAAVLLASLPPILSLLRSDRVATVPGMLNTRSASPLSGGRSALVVVQIALAAVLLVSAGLLGRSFVKVLAVDPGVATRHLIAAQVFAYDRNETAAKRIAFFSDTIERIRALPGVESVGAASTVPFLDADIDIATTIVVEGAPPLASGEERRVYLSSATPDYFKAAGIVLRRGRVFTNADAFTSSTVAIINETAARRHFPDQDPIGRSITVMDSGRKKTAQIVGIAGDVRFGGLEGASRPEVILPHTQSPSATMTYVVRTGYDATSMLNQIKKAVWSVDPLQTFYEAGAVSDMVDKSLRPRVFALRLVMLFAGVGFALAIAGAYSAVAWAMRRRTAEFGIRLALGAQAADIRRHMLSYGLRLAAAGIAAGLVVAALLSRLLQSLLFGIDAHDPATLAAIAALLLSAVLAACAIPARRAGRIDPVSALRG